MNKTTLLALFIPLAIYFLLTFGLPSLVRINVVGCISQYGPCSSYLDEAIASLNHKTLREVKIGLKDFLKKEVSVSDFSLQYKIPDKVIVNLIEKKAKFAIKDRNNNKFALIDEKGLVLKAVDNTNLPYLTVLEGFPEVGDSIDQKNLFALNLIYDLFTSYQVKNGNIEEQRLQVVLPSGISAIFPLEGDKETLLGSLSLILSRLKDSEKDTRIGDNRISIIDLRFKNPILK